MLASINPVVRGLPSGPPNRSSAVCMWRLARIEAMIPMTRFRPSSIAAQYHFRSVFAKEYTVRNWPECKIAKSSVEFDWHGLGVGEERLEHQHPVNHHFRFCSTRHLFHSRVC